MKFAHDFTSPVTIALTFLCALLVGIFGVLLVVAAYRRARDRKLLGDASLVQGLITYEATGLRAFKGTLLVLGMVLAFAALARPQFGRGTKIIPATNLDVVIVLDYSKSMYARDVVPNRISRAKAEVADLVRKLPGARFGAVAFAGEPMSFPLTSDGAAIAQFFRQLEPNDMPIGGTATARALERARELFARDPKSKDHVRVIVLVTDGEDLEGDPLRVAEGCAVEKTRIDVVQIGGRAPEPIPEVGADGKVSGIRRDEQGKPLTTELSAEGEAQLAEIAQKTGGAIVRAQKGETGIEQIAKNLSKLQREELSERVETVFAEAYAWPLGLALCVLFVEAMVLEAPRRKRRFVVPAPAPRADRPDAKAKEKAKDKSKDKKPGTKRPKAKAKGVQE
jgi:Ca-activated chloride channel family protein